MCHNMLNVLPCATQWVAIDWVEEARLPPTSKQVTPQQNDVDDDDDDGLDADDVGDGDGLQ